MKIKQLKIKKIIILIVILLLVIIPVIFSLSSSYEVLITDNDQKFYKAKSILIIGNYLFCLKDFKIFKSRKMALKNFETSFKPSVVSIKNVLNIEIIQDEASSGIEIKPQYLGTFKIDATGHKGVLVILKSKKYLYGYVKFPNWANGVSEPLKNVNVRNGKIRFIRSVTNAKELKRVGAGTFFTQKYFGDYSNNGKYIKGFFLKKGAKFVWEAEKIR